MDNIFLSMTIILLDYSYLLYSIWTNYMSKTRPNKKIYSKERFIKTFIDVAFESMAIEQEVPLSRREAYKRYRQEAIDLIADGTYKKRCTHRIQQFDTILFS